MIEIDVRVAGCLCEEDVEDPNSREESEVEKNG